jgi:hypothetical protein
MLIERFVRSFLFQSFFRKLGGKDSRCIIQLWIGGLKRAFDHKFAQMAVFFIGLGVLLSTTSCSQLPAVDDSKGANSDSVKTETAVIDQDSNEYHSSDSSFGRYLRFFSDVHPLEQWPEDALASLVLNNEFWNEDKTDRDFTLKYLFHKIDPILWRWIPSTKITALTPKAARIEMPLSRYTFYAFAKERKEGFWLVSMFGMKNELEQDVYHRHPFLLVTYSEEGSLIDEFIWWTIVDDDIQVCDLVDVSGDTLLIGTKENLNDAELSEVFGKVVITKKGLFESVYSNYPPGYGK